MDSELSKKHRQERKEMQAKIQMLKKSVPKGDRRKKMEVAEIIVKMEKEIDDRQDEELEKAVEINDGEDTKVNAENGTTLEDVVLQAPTKITRAQRRRNKKSEEEREREKRISEQEETNRQGPRVLEMNTIKEILKTSGLNVVNIPADGNCLYCAVNHQLEITGREESDVPELRKLTAEFMRKNKADFLPFMYNESDELVDDVQFESYCRDVASTKLWGGQLELRALSNVLRCPIKVIQASGPAMIQGENFAGPPLVLTYHRHLYRLGEHYNSTAGVKMQND